ncbi:MAG: RHS repeat-associated core domain-containing protein, partial [Clostridia bacterium]|nr:RHS repeat-associated core domain-containing protein [Clostridia bacterium]
DVTALTDSTGVITKSYLYDAFGVEQNASSTDNNPFRYCGEYFDDETDMTYLRNRYYNSSIGRFVSEDPIKDGWNWYVYCGNNPVNYQDSTGYIREPGYNKNGEWSSNPDWDDYGDIPYVYDSLETLGNNWLVATADQRLSIKALADFVRTVGDDFRTGIRAWTFGGVLDKQRISSTEKIVAIANPLGALNVDNAQEIAWTEVQSRYGADIPPGSLDGSNANAFLHCYWNALITKKIGSYWAKLFTDAHEYGINNNLGLNAQMDLFNNSVGIYIGENIENKDNAHIANTVQNYVNYGWLLRNKVNGVVQNINIPTNSDYR